MKIYVAGPFGFSEAGRAYYNQTLLPALAAAGFEPLDPWGLNNDPSQLAMIQAMPPGDERRAAYGRLNEQIGRNNTATIDRCDGVFAILDGVDVDSGTAAEIGYAFAMKKPIVGYRGDFRLSADNEGAIVNLQVEYFIRASGGTIRRTLDDAIGALRALAIGNN
ncbi:MAG TPA: nucleoside 2-deoxyribosyltransferase [Tepidisphaeraceae bacterium]|jgi:nucleoside 2-deoxyribosyltransferase|nr:nucleoside 2-deoxyribosyltransferase [Tepidisphaeraceae bacterium]